MILKLKTFENAQKGWKFIDNVIQATKSEVAGQRPEYPSMETTMKILNNDGAQDSKTEDIAFNCIEILSVRTLRDEFQTLLVYTELPAYLLNDKGETIERLN